MERIAEALKVNSGPIVTTLLDLTHAIAESSSSDEEAVATMLHLIESGRVRIVGEFQAADLREARVEGCTYNAETIK